MESWYKSLLLQVSSLILRQASGLRFSLTRRRTFRTPRFIPFENGSPRPCRSLWLGASERTKHEAHPDIDFVRSSASPPINETVDICGWMHGNQHSPGSHVTPSAVLRGVCERTNHLACPSPPVRCERTNLPPSDSAAPLFVRSQPASWLGMSAASGIGGDSGWVVVWWGTTPRLPTPHLRMNELTSFPSHPAPS